MINPILLISNIPIVWSQIRIPYIHHGLWEVLERVKEFLELHVDMFGS